MCVTVVQWSRNCLHCLQINWVRLPATVTLFSFFLVVPFFLCLVSGFNTIFPFGLFSCIRISDPAGHALGSSIKLKSGVVFWERDFKSS